MDPRNVSWERSKVFLSFAGCLPPLLWISGRPLPAVDKSNAHVTVSFFSCSTSSILDGFQGSIIRAIESPIVFFLPKAVHPRYRGDSGRPFLLAPLIS
jgi:hypothetical protein